MRFADRRGAKIQKKKKKKKRYVLILSHNK